MTASARILLVEDDEVDAEIIGRAFRRAGSTREIVLARDGVEALELVRGREGMPALSRPYIVLLDLRMPKMRGEEVLAALRADPATADIPVFVLSTSAAERHVRMAYAAHVAGYIVKRDSQEAMSRVARLLDCYCDVVALP